MLYYGVARHRFESWRGPRFIASNILVIASVSQFKVILELGAIITGATNHTKPKYNKKKVMFSDPFARLASTDFGGEGYVEALNLNLP